MYREWRKANGNKKPNRVIVRMHWEDEPENSLVDTIGIVRFKKIGDTCEVPGDWSILYQIAYQTTWTDSDKTPKLFQPRNRSRS